MSLKNRIFHKKGNIAIFVLSLLVYAAVRSAFNINPNDILVVFPIVWVAVWIKCMTFVVVFYVFDCVWEYLLVHCDAGISRSPAVATAIAEFYFNDHEFHLHHPCYNRMVYHILRYRMEERKENECQA